MDPKSELHDRFEDELPYDEGEWKVGDLVRFWHQADTGPDHRIVAIEDDLFVELEGMVGHFGPGLLVRAPS